MRRGGERGREREEKLDPIYNTLFIELNSAMPTYFEVDWSTCKIFFYRNHKGAGEVKLIITAL